MKQALINRIRADLEESHVDGKLIIAFIPIAFFTYLFHEFGHWTLGELLGNDMTLSLNNSSPRGGSFNSDSAALWSAIGGPLFTVFQGLIFLWLIGLTRSMYAYSFTFGAVFTRFFSILFGGIDRQDEARIAFMMDVNKYLVAAFVLAILTLILWRAMWLMKLEMKALGYFVILGIYSVLIVIGINAYLD